MTIFNKNIDIYLYSIYTKNDMQNAAFNNYTKKKRYVALCRRRSRRCCCC